MELKICHLYPDLLNLYGDRFGSDADASRPAAAKDPFDDPFAAEEATPEKETAAPTRRGFTSDIPPFLRGRRK